MSKGHILVVDDEKNILSSLEGILSDEGFTISKAEDGDSALRLIENHSPDLVMLDIWIPGMDGLQTLKAIKKLTPQVEVIMMSGHGSIETAVKATKMGAFDFIEKPLSMENILSVVDTALKKRRGIGEHELKARKTVDQIIGTSPEIESVKKLVEKASKQSKNVLIEGPAGSGKRFLATIIHQNSSLEKMPLVMLSCQDWYKKTRSEKISRKNTSPIMGAASLSEKLDQAKGGSIIFNEIHLLPAEDRQILLSAIKEGSITVNGKKTPVQARIIATVNKDTDSPPLFEEVDKELLEVLSEISISVPPLKKRGDISELITYFVKESAEEYGQLIKGFEKDAMESLLAHQWRGDIYELKHSIEQMVITEKEELITLKTLSDVLSLSNRPSQSVDSAKGAKSKRSPSTKNSGEKKKKKIVKSIENRACRGIRQRTLKRSVVLCGQGLHSGLKTGLILSPLPPHSGILFGDISSGDTVPALIDYVESTQYATTLKRGAASVKTIEHLMAVLHMYRISNLLLKMGDEVPIMDGSAVDFCQLIEDGGLKDQKETVGEIIIDKPFTINGRKDGVQLTIEPSESFSISYYLNYPKPVGEQEYEFHYDNPDHFKKEIAPARTFGFLKDFEKMEEMGLGGGGKLSNFILVDDEKIINTSLRFPNEFVRHKILDIIGDFYLLGHPIRGKITARMTGHSENIQMVRKIREAYLPH